MIPSSILSVVVLPAPFGPRMPVDRAYPGQQMSTPSTRRARAIEAFHQPARLERQTGARRRENGVLGSPFPDCPTGSVTLTAISMT